MEFVDTVINITSTGQPTGEGATQDLPAQGSTIPAERVPSDGNREDTRWVVPMDVQSNSAEDGRSEEQPEPAGYQVSYESTTAEGEESEQEENVFQGGVPATAEVGATASSAAVMTADPEPEAARLDFQLEPCQDLHPWTQQFTDELTRSVSSYVRPPSYRPLREGEYTFKSCLNGNTVELRGFIQIDSPYSFEENHQLQRSMDFRLEELLPQSPRHNFFHTTEPQGSSFGTTQQETLHLNLIPIPITGIYPGAIPANALDNWTRANAYFQGNSAFGYSPNCPTSNSRDTSNTSIPNSLYGNCFFPTPLCCTNFPMCLQPLYFNLTTNRLQRQSTQNFQYPTSFQRTRNQFPYVLFPLMRQGSSFSTAMGGNLHGSTGGQFDRRRRYQNPELQRHQHSRDFYSLTSRKPTVTHFNQAHCERNKQKPELSRITHQTNLFTGNLMTQPPPSRPPWTFAHKTDCQRPPPSTQSIETIGTDSSHEQARPCSSDGQDVVPTQSESTYNLGSGRNDVQTKTRLCSSGFGQDVVPTQSESSYNLGSGRDALHTTSTPSRSYAGLLVQSDIHTLAGPSRPSTGISTQEYVHSQGGPSSSLGSGQDIVHTQSDPVYTNSSGRDALHTPAEPSRSSAALFAQSDSLAGPSRSPTGTSTEGHVQSQGRPSTILGSGSDSVPPHSEPLDNLSSVRVVIQTQARQCSSGLGLEVVPTQSEPSYNLGSGRDALHTTSTPSRSSAGLLVQSYADILAGPSRSSTGKLTQGYVHSHGVPYSILSSGQDVGPAQSDPLYTQSSGRDALHTPAEPSRSSEALFAQSDSLAGPSRSSSGTSTQVDVQTKGGPSRRFGSGQGAFHSQAGRMPISGFGQRLIQPPPIVSQFTQTQVNDLHDPVSRGQAILAQQRGRSLPSPWTYRPWEPTLRRSRRLEEQNMSNFKKKN